MRRTLVLNVVGLTRELLGEDTPSLSDLLGPAVAARPLKAVLPAVTC